MSKLTLSDLAKRMRSIDIAMLSTHAEDGSIAGRPMSNNGEVEYDGDSYYFTWADSPMIADIERDPKVALAFLGEKAFSVAVEGEGEVTRDQGAFAAHWNADLDRWFKDGVRTEGLAMIKVRATRIHYWDGMDDGEITP